MRFMLSIFFCLAFAAPASGGVPDCSPGLDAALGPEASEQDKTQAFKVDQLPLVDALLKLGREYEVPLGIEYIDFPAVEKPLTLDLPQATFSQALDALVCNFSGYTWSFKDGVAIVTHQRVQSLGDKNLLNQTLPRVSIPRTTYFSASHILEMRLERHLHPEIKGFAGSRIPSPSNMLVGPLALENITVREVLNRLVAETGRAAWVVQVPPERLYEVPSYGLWRIIEYDHVLPYSTLLRLVLLRSEHD